MGIKHYDVVIIGSGVGGLTAAARLTFNGAKVLLIERSPRLGGRCSHHEKDGFKLTTGAIMVPIGEQTAFQQAFDLVGAPLHVRETAGAFRYRLAHGDYEPPKRGGGLQGMLQFALQGDEARSEQLFQRFHQALTRWRPTAAISFKAWLNQYCDDPQVHRLYQGFCGAFIGTNAEEVPASEFFTFLHQMSRGKRYGIAIHGNGEMMETLAATVVAKGGVIRRRSACHAIRVEQNRVVGIDVINEKGEMEQIDAPIVISNVGPAKTVELAGEASFEESYLATLRQVPYEAPVVHIGFATEEPLIPDFSGILNFGNTTGLVFFETPSLTCPELAPAGQYLSTTYSVARDSAHPDLNAVARATLQELEDNFPGFSRKARILVTAKHRGESPAMRRWPGYTMPVETPIDHLYNVGDGCMPPGTVGIESAALSAKLVVDRLSRSG